MKKIATIFVAASLALVTLPFTAEAQSESFKIGKSLDTQYAILKQLKQAYVDTIKTDELVKTGIDAMLESLDPYTVYIPEEEDEDLELMTSGTYGGIGALIQKRGLDSNVVITEPYPDSPASKSGLIPGDEIIEIDGKTVKGETSDQSTGRMKGVPGTDVNFRIIRSRSRDTTNVTVKRERIHISSIDYYGIIRDSIGYISLNGFTTNMTKEFKSDFQSLKSQGMKRLVIDLRSNGGGLMNEATDLLSLFVPKNTMVLSSKGRAEQMNEQYFTQSSPIDTLIPILVMVNSGSASASEITAGAIQDLDRGTIAGTRTFGKGLVQSIMPLPYGGQMKLTTAKYYTPSGRCVQAIDYSHRNEDGSVGQIPDSLTHEFRTKNGRIVKDGGGITPDITEKSQMYSRPTVSLVYSGITDDYALKYFKEHESIAPAKDFHLTDAEYEDFVKYAVDRKWDARSAAEVELDELKKAAQNDAIYENFKADFDALSTKLNVGKAEMMRMKRAEIKEILEAQIVSKYYFSNQSKVIDLRTDDQLYNSIDRWISGRTDGSSR
jgi:carboxyl-terminal processing protease